MSSRLAGCSVCMCDIYHVYRKKLDICLGRWCRAWGVMFAELIFTLPDGQGCWSASFHLFKIHMVTWCPWPRTWALCIPTTDTSTPLPSSVLCKQMNTRLRLAVLPVYPVRHLFSSCHGAHLCNICVWTCCCPLFMPWLWLTSSVSENVSVEFGPVYIFLRQLLLWNGLLCV